MSILSAERLTYQEMWGVEQYAAYAPGEGYVSAFLDMSHTTMRSSVLDAGCGTGKGALALQAAGFDRVTLCDLTSEGLVPAVKDFTFFDVCLWHDLKRSVGFHDWVYCCDVLEHIPTPFTMLVVQRLLEVSRRGVFLSIALRPDEFGAWVGKGLHQTVQSYTDWKTQLRELGTIIECRDLLHTGLYLVRP